jgi:hypothetical protein
MKQCRRDKQLNQTVHGSGQLQPKTWPVHLDQPTMEILQALQKSTHFLAEVVKVVIILNVLAAAVVVCVWLVNNG